MERIKLTNNEKYILLELGKTKYGTCNTSELLDLSDSEIKSTVESLEYKDLAVDDVPLSEGIITQIALTQKGKQYLRENPKLKNPNKIMDAIKTDTRSIIVYVIGVILAALLILYFGLK